MFFCYKAETYIHLSLSCIIYTLKSNTLTRANYYSTTQFIDVINSIIYNILIIFVKIFKSMACAYNRKSVLHANSVSNFRIICSLPKYFSGNVLIRQTTLFNSHSLIAAQLLYDCGECTFIAFD